MGASLLHLAAWTHEAVHAECRDAYNRYSRELDAHYVAYFAAHAEERGTHLRQAIDIERALPPGWDHCADQLPERVRHRHHLSGRSSQVLALGLLCSAAKLDPGLSWLFELLSPLPLMRDVPVWRFEYVLAPEALNEQ